MNSLFTFLRSEWLECLQHTLLHTLWQGVLWCIVLFIMLQIIPVARPQHRYLATVGVLCGLLISAMLTWCVLDYNATPSISTLEGVEMVAASTTDTVESPLLETSLSPSAPAVQSIPHKPQQWLLPLWFIGVCVMLFRMLRMLWGANTIRHACHPLEDPIALVCLDDIKRRLGIVRNITLLVGEHIVSPAVVGIVWPALLLPASMVSGLPPTHFQAILAHELAHVRRYDHLVNFFQLIAESLLYFNPTVWWISRQIRIEREACCDAIAASVTGSTTDYVEALAGATQYLRTLSPSVALPLGGTDQKTGLIDRVRRLLVPGYLPKMRLPWYSIVIGFASVAVLLAGLYESSALTVLFAGRFLSDGERAKAIDDIAENYALPGNSFAVKSEENEVHIEGTITTWDDKALPEGEDYTIEAWLEMGPSGYHSTSKNLQLIDGRFSGTVWAGTVYLNVAIPGYAPASIGPYFGRVGQPLKDIEIVLQKSVPASIHFVSPEGETVTNVKVSGSYYFQNTKKYVNIFDFTKNNDLYTYEQAANPLSASLKVTAKGYQPESKQDLYVAGGEVYEWKLRPAIPLHGIVVDADTGQPIRNAELVLQYSNPYLETGKSTDFNNKSGVMATSGPDGKFTLDTLNEHGEYRFIVRAEGYGFKLIQNILTLHDGAIISLHRRYISGVIQGDVNSLDKDRSGNPVLRAFQNYQFINSEITFQYKAELKPVNASEIQFRFNELLPGEVTIHAGPKRIPIEVNEPVENVIIQLKESSTQFTTREIIYNLIPPPNSPMVKGELVIQTRHSSGSKDAFPYPQTYTIENNRAIQQVKLPADIKLGYGGLIGYFVDLTKTPEIHNIPKGEEPYFIDVHLAPAGAIYGELLKADGDPFSNTEISISSADSKRPLPHQIEYSLRRTTTREDGKFVFQSLPFGWRYVVSTSDGLALVQSKPIKISKSKSIHHIQLQMKEGITLTGKVLGLEGQPVSGIPITVLYTRKDTKKSTRDMTRKTDKNGEFLLRNFEPENFTDVQIIAGPHESYRKVAFDLVDKDTPIVLQMESGLTVKGTVINKVTKEPVPSVKIFFSESDFSGYSGCEVTTNRKGQFSISCLDSTEYSVYVMSPGFTTDAVYVKPPNSEPIQVFVTLPEGYQSIGN